MKSRSLPDAIVAGFIPLIDSAVLVVAGELGFAEQQGIELKLVRETSWANIRDRIAVGHLDVAHMLAPMAIAGNLGLAPLPAALIAPMALGTGGNTITVSNALWAQMTEFGASGAGDPAGIAKSMAGAFQVRKSRGLPLPVFGIVHPYSSHHYELAYLLGFAGVRPGIDVELTVVPPSLMTDALARGQLDGFCVGEPWGSMAVARGVGVIATTKAAIWKASPEKVLGLRLDWAERNPELLAALLRALYLAACWCEQADNRPRLAAILSQDRYLGLPEAILLESLQGGRPGGREDQRASLGAPFMFADRASTFPWSSHASWFYSQMVRWGQVRHSAANAAKARETFRPDLYRSALGPLGVAVPSSNSKVEGALTAATPVGSPTGRLVLGPDGFFDGRIFDPDRVDDYIAGFEVHA